MPKDISSSSSEDEVENPTTEPVAPVRETEKITKYECPADFVSFNHVPCSNTLADRFKKNKNELWLIKAPASFNPECFSGIKVPLSGLQTLKVPTSAAPESDQKIYSILASDHATPELRLLTSSKQASNAVAFGPAFTGLLNICESYGDSSANQAPQVIPAAPAPAIPTGLKQRFHPFGSKTPTLTFVAENEADGAAFGPSSTTLRPLVVKQFVDEAEEEGRKRKKKKKEKRIKSEVMEAVVAVKQEPDDEIQEEAMMELPFQEGNQMVEKRKKKKKKKDREQEEVEGGLEPNVKVKVEEVSVKSEPMDAWLGDAAESKKKKKKKKSRSDDD